MFLSSFLIDLNFQLSNSGTIFLTNQQDQNAALQAQVQDDEIPDLIDQDDEMPDLIDHVVQEVP